MLTCTLCAALESMRFTLRQLGLQPLLRKCHMRLYGCRLHQLLQCASKQISIFQTWACWIHTFSVLIISRNSNIGMVFRFPPPQESDFFVCHYSLWESYLGVWEGVFQATALAFPSCSFSTLKLSMEPQIPLQAGGNVKIMLH